MVPFGKRQQERRGCMPARASFFFLRECSPYMQRWRPALVVIIYACLGISIDCPKGDVSVGERGHPDALLCGRHGSCTEVHSHLHAPDQPRMCRCVTPATCTSIWTTHSAGPNSNAPESPLLPLPQSRKCCRRCHRPGCTWWGQVVL